MVPQFSDQSYVPVIVIGFITFYQNIIVITRYSIHVVSQSASTEISLFLSTSCVHHRSDVGWIPKPKSNPEKCASLSIEITFTVSSVRSEPVDDSTTVQEQQSYRDFCRIEPDHNNPSHTMHMKTHNLISRRHVAFGCSCCGFYV